MALTGSARGDTSAAQRIGKTDHAIEEDARFKAGIYKIQRFSTGHVAVAVVDADFGRSPVRETHDRQNMVNLREIPNCWWIR